MKVAHGLKSGELKLSCEDPDNPRNFPRNLFVWRSNLSARAARATNISSSICSERSMASRARTSARKARCKPEEVVWRRRGSGGQARPAGRDRFPHVDHLRLCRRRPTDRHLVREERPQHLGHAPLHPSAVEGGGPGLGRAQRLGDLQGHREELLGSLRGPSRRGDRCRPAADAARHAGRALRSRSTSRTGRKASATRFRARPCRPSSRSSATIPTPTRSSLQSARC